MGFVEETLMPNEKIMFSTKLSKFNAITSTLIFGSIGFIFISKLPVIGILFFMIVISMWISYRTSEFAVTNRRVLIKVGVFRRKSFEILLSKIESIKFDQSLS